MFPEAEVGRPSSRLSPLVPPMQANQAWRVTKGLLQRTKGGGACSRRQVVHMKYADVGLLMIERNDGATSDKLKRGKRESRGLGSPGTDADNKERFKAPRHCITAMLKQLLRWPPG